MVTGPEGGGRSEREARADVVVGEGGRGRE